MTAQNKNNQIGKKYTEKQNLFHQQKVGDEKDAGKLALGVAIITNVYVTVYDNNPDETHFITQQIHAILKIFLKLLLLNNDIA